jgi:hypothetical protein
VDYQPMSIARLADFIGDEPDFDVRWRLVVEFLKEYHREPARDRQRLLAFDTPGARAGHCSFPRSLPQARRVRCRLRNRRGVSDPSPLLDRAALEDAFRRLGERLARLRIHPARAKPGETGAPPSRGTSPATAARPRSR